MLMLPHRFIIWKLSIWYRFEICRCPTFFFLLFSVREHLPVISNAVNRLALCWIFPLVFMTMRTWAASHALCGSSALMQRVSAWWPMVAGSCPWKSCLVWVVWAVPEQGLSSNVLMPGEQGEKLAVILHLS